MAGPGGSLGMGHHGCVADERDAENRTDSGAVVPRADGAPLPGQPEADAELLRRFEQFQQFQQFTEFQRAQELAANGEPDAIVRRPDEDPESGRQAKRPPAWLTAAAGKVVTALLVLAAVVIGIGWAIDHFLGGEEPQAPAQQAKQNRDTPIEAEGQHWANNPYEAVRRIYHDIADGDVEYACLRFTEGSAERFAANTGHSSCTATARSAHNEVAHQKGQNDYAESIPSYVPPEMHDRISKVAPGASVTIDSCTASAQTGGISGGPALGKFVVTRLADVYGEQWAVTGHRAGPERCP